MASIAPQNEQTMDKPKGFWANLWGGEGRAWQLIRESGILGALIILIIVGAIISPHFLKPTNLINVIRQIAIVGIIGIGMTFVILTAGIDLSVGSIVGFVAVLSASMLRAGAPWYIVIPVGLAAGGAIGALNGFGITKGNLQPFIMTLGMLVIARGVTMTYSEGQPISIGEAAESFSWLGAGDWLGIPVPVWLLLLVAVLAGLTLTYTPWGRHIYAVGDNVEAARLSGINTTLVTFGVYVISGVMAALSALILVSRLTTGEPLQGTGFELDAIAIVVIGGTSLFGGEGGVRGTLVGAAIVAVLANLLNLVGVSPFSQQIVKGLIIISAVLLERRRASLMERR
ncbi:MAG: ABC transporter permease [Anaerolineae bacterium]|nr:ABC transporter permease [Anaerolineae bacterium]